MSGNRLMPVFIMLFVLLTVSACKDDKKADTNTAPQSTPETAMSEDLDSDQMKADKAREEAEANSIAAKAMASSDLSTLTGVLKSADLDSMLTSKGSYTVFAPSNNAFTKLPESTVDTLLKPENKEQLRSILQYHVVPGTITTDRLVMAIKGNGGKYAIKTATGEELTAMMDGDQIVIKDGRGKKTHVLKGNIEASNGVVYVIDDVLMAHK